MALFDTVRNPKEPEKLFVIGRATTTLVADQVVSWDATSITNNYLTTPATATLGLVAGVMTKALATDEFGLVQAYGYYPSALCLMHTSASTDAASGAPLFAKASSPSWDFLADSVVSTGVNAVYAVTLDAITFVTDITHETHKVFLRCL